LCQPGISSAIVGASHAHHVVENVKASQIDLSDYLINEIEPILIEIEEVLPAWY